MEGREKEEEKRPVHRPTDRDRRTAAAGNDFLKGNSLHCVSPQPPYAKDSIKSESTVGRLRASEKAIEVLLSSEEVRCLRCSYLVILEIL